MRRILTVLAVAALASPGIAYADTATTNLITVATDGATPAGGSDEPSVSADGRYVAFISSARDLVPGDTNGATDAFVRDRQTGATTRVSVDSAGTQADNVSENPSISGDGRYVVFGSYASNLAPGDTNDEYDIFLRDREASTTTRIDLDVNGRQLPRGTAANVYPSISADGRLVAYESGVDSLVAGDVNHEWDVFLWNRDTATTSLGSVATDGTPGDNASGKPSISADGRHLAFESVAKNFAPGMPEFGYSDNVYARDLVST